MNMDIKEDFLLIKAILNSFLSKTKAQISYDMLPIFAPCLVTPLPTVPEKAPTVKHSSSLAGFRHSLSLPSSTLARLDLPEPVGPSTINLEYCHISLNIMAIISVKWHQVE